MNPSSGSALCLLPENCRQKKKWEIQAPTRSPGTHSSNPAAAAAALPTFELPSPLAVWIDKIRLTSAILKDASNSTPLQHVDGRLYYKYISSHLRNVVQSRSALIDCSDDILETRVKRRTVWPSHRLYDIASFIRRNGFNYYRREISFS